MHRVLSNADNPAKKYISKLYADMPASKLKVDSTALGENYETRLGAKLRELGASSVKEMAEKGHETHFYEDPRKLYADEGKFFVRFETKESRQNTAMRALESASSTDLEEQEDEPREKDEE